MPSSFLALFLGLLLLSLSAPGASLPCKCDPTQWTSDDACDGKDPTQDEIDDIFSPPTIEPPEPDYDSWGNPLVGDMANGLLGDALSLIDSFSAGNDLPSTGQPSGRAGSSKTSSTATRLTVLLNTALMEIDEWHQVMTAAQRMLTIDQVRRSTGEMDYDNDGLEDIFNTAPAFPDIVVITEEQATHIPSDLVARLDHLLENPHLISVKEDFKRNVRHAREMIRARSAGKLDESEYTARAPQSHNYTDAPKPDWADCCCTTEHYLYQVPYMTVYFMLGSPGFSFYFDAEAGGCADYYNNLDMERWALLYQLLEILNLVSKVLGVVCDIFETCLPQKVVNLVINVFEAFKRGGQYHLDMSHTEIQDFIHAGLDEIHHAIECLPLDERRLSFYRVGCNGQDDNCDHDIDDPAEDNYPPTLMYPSTDELGWFNDRDAAAKHLQSEITCTDDCNQILGGNILFAEGGIAGDCEDASYTVRCTDSPSSNYVEKDIPIFVDETAPVINMCVERDVLHADNKFYDVGFAYRVTDNCGTSTDIVKVTLSVYVNEDLTKETHKSIEVIAKSKNPDDYVRLRKYNAGDRYIILGLMAQRLNNGYARTYKLVMKAEDAAGNSVTSQTKVTIDENNQDPQYPDGPFALLKTFTLDSLTSGTGSSCLGGSVASVAQNGELHVAFPAVDVTQESEKHVTYSLNVV